METGQVYSELETHTREFLAGQEITDCIWALGPTQKMWPRFRVLCVSPGPKSNLWVYVSLGAWEINRANGSSVEFMIFAAEESPRHIELLAMTAYYHFTHTLGLGHTLPIGEPWLEGSNCDHLLVSLPYPFGPELEICEIDREHIHFFWLLPITSAERNFKARYGLEALEELFEKGELEYWSVRRASVV
jgi:Suppressor of fused protein (SUFU)